MSKPTVNIVVIGGGTGGTLTANLLAKNLSKEIWKGEVNIHLIAASSKHVFQPGNLDVAFRGEDPSKFVRAERKLVDPDVNLIEDRVELISLAKKTVLLGSGTELSYDYLVIATGSVANPGVIPGLKEASLNFHTSGDESRKI